MCLAGILQFYKFTILQIYKIKFCHELNEMSRSAHKSHICQPAIPYWSGDGRLILPKNVLLEIE